MLDIRRSVAVVAICGAAWLGSACSSDGSGQAVNDQPTSLAASQSTENVADFPESEGVYQGSTKIPADESTDLPFPVAVSWDFRVSQFDRDVSSAPAGEEALTFRVDGEVTFEADLEGRELRVDALKVPLFPATLGLDVSGIVPNGLTNGGYTTEIVPPGGMYTLAFSTQAVTENAPVSTIDSAEEQLLNGRVTWRLVSEGSMTISRISIDSIDLRS